ncbi:MAG: zinc-binding dehydrogenase [Bacteroidales bacterium]|nr:zinc-binding dehydrogenase [Bacteroidales bacterium]
MQAIFFNKPDAICKIQETQIPEPGDNDVLIKIKAAALNRRDFWIKKGIYQGAKFPCIIGSDGAGKVEKVGKNVDKAWLNEAVIINPGLNWGDDPDAHGPDFHILGLPTQGTFAQYIVVNADSIWHKPDGWTFEKAAALPLAALTAYRAMFTRGNLRKGQKVFITGAGGGVAVYLIQFAVAAGAKVYVSSSSEKKIKKAVALGVEGGVFYNQPGWETELENMAKGKFDLIIDSAAGTNFEKFPGLLNTGGKIVNFGGTAGKIPEMTAAKIFWKQASILGTTMGSPTDFKDMISFVKKHHIEPVIDKIFPMVDAELAFKQMENHEQFGKIVIKITDVY